MSQARVNVYTFPHKGLRVALSKLGMAAGNTDYTNAEAIEDLKALAAEVKALLDHHAQLEERFLLAHLEEKVPGSTANNLEEHRALERTIAGWMQQVGEITPESGAEAGARFYKAIFDFFSTYIEHMAMEEGIINPLIWENFTDEELGALHGKVMASFTPEEIASSFKYIVPALNPIERNMIMTGFKTNAPPVFFNQIVEMLSTHMSPRDHSQLLAMAGA